MKVWGEMTHALGDPHDLHPGVTTFVPRSLITLSVMFLMACGENMMEKHAAQRLADGYARYLGGASDEAPADTAAGLTAVLARLKESVPKQCVSRLRRGDLRPPYGDGSADYVVTLLCDERSILGLRLSVERDRVKVLGWSERVVE